MIGCLISPNEVYSLDTPPGESPSPSPIPLLEPHIQIQMESTKDEEEGDQAASTSFIEIHAVSMRRSSEPLPFSLSQPHAEPPRETVTHLTVSSEQRSSPLFIFYFHPHSLSNNANC